MSSVLGSGRSPPSPGRVEISGPARVGGFGWFPWFVGTSPDRIFYRCYLFASSSLCKPPGTVCIFTKSPMISHSPPRFHSYRTCPPKQVFLEGGKENILEFYEEKGKLFVFMNKKNLRFCSYDR